MVYDSLVFVTEPNRTIGDFFNPYFVQIADSVFDELHETFVGLRDGLVCPPCPADIVHALGRTDTFLKRWEILPEIIRESGEKHIPIKSDNLFTEYRGIV